MGCIQPLKLYNTNTPFEILALAKAQSKLHQIESLTWFSSMRIVKKNIEAFGEAKVFINSISNQILSNKEWEDLERWYEPILDRVVIEVSANECFDGKIAFQKHEYIKKWGGSLALEDLGTNYDNENNLLLAEYVKIDMSMVQNVDQGASRRKLL